MKTKSLRNALMENGHLDKLKKVVTGSEKLSESQLKNVAAGSEDDSGCIIYIGESCVIYIGPIETPPPAAEEQSNRANQTS